MEMKGKVTIGNKTFAYVKTSDLTISKYNVRPEQTIEEKEEIRDELAKSIKEIGLQQLPVITPAGEVFIGGRRTVAFQELGEEWMLAEIRDATPFEQMIASYTENFHRKSPDYMNEGELFKRMCEIGQITETELAKKLGVSQPYISDRIRIYDKLHDYHAVINITFEQARMIKSVPEKEKRENLIKMVEEGLETQELNKIIATTNAVKAMLDGETKEVKKQLEDEFKDKFYTPELDIAEVKWKAEELAGDSHPTTRGRIWWDEEGITNTDEAEEWFQRYGGRFLRDLKGSEGEWDRTMEKLEKKQKKEAKKE